MGKKVDVEVSELLDLLKSVDVKLIESIKKMKKIESIDCDSEEELQLKIQLLALNCEQLKKILAEIDFVGK